jgi:hypothetical protein
MRRKGRSRQCSASCERIVCEGGRVTEERLEGLEGLFNANWPDCNGNRHRVLIYLASQSYQEPLRWATRKNLEINITSLSLDPVKLRGGGDIKIAAVTNVTSLKPRLEIGGYRLTLRAVTVSLSATVSLGWAKI